MIFTQRIIGMKKCPFRNLDQMKFWWKLKLLESVPVMERFTVVLKSFGGSQARSPNLMRQDSQLYQVIHNYKGCRKVWKSGVVGGARSSLVGIIWPPPLLNEVGLRCEIFVFFLLSFPQREKYISFAQFVHFLREVCLLFNFYHSKIEK